MKRRGVRATREPGGSSAARSTVSGSRSGSPAPAALEPQRPGWKVSSRDHPVTLTWASATPSATAASRSGE